MKCKDCPYYAGNDENGYEYCSYFVQPLDRVIILSMCKWIDYEDYNKDKDGGDADEL